MSARDTGAGLTGHWTGPGAKTNHWGDWGGNVDSWGGRSRDRATGYGTTLVGTQVRANTNTSTQSCVLVFVFAHERLGRTGVWLRVQVWWVRVSYPQWVPRARAIP